MEGVRFSDFPILLLCFLIFWSLQAESGLQVLFSPGSFFVVTVRIDHVVSLPRVEERC